MSEKPAKRKTASKARAGVESPAASEAFGIEALLGGVIRFRETSPVLPVVREPTIHDHIEDLLDAALDESVDTSAIDETGEKARHGKAAKELYHIMLKAGQAVAKLAKEKPEALRGIGRGHVDAFIPYLGSEGNADVEAWLRLIGLSESFRIQTKRKPRSDRNQTISDAVRLAFLSLHRWRDLRMMEGEAAMAAIIKREIKQPEDLDVALAIKTKARRGESEYSKGERSRFQPEFHLRLAAKYLPSPTREDWVMGLWTRCALAWLRLPRPKGDERKLSRDEAASLALRLRHSAEVERKLSKFRAETMTRDGWRKGVVEKVGSAIEALIDEASPT